ncbi:MAG: class I SAM-dependent methyltransferase [Polyangiaceae bacterium]
MTTPVDAALRCPDCLSELRGDGETARCASCGASYVAHDGVWDLLGSKSEINASELETQDRVSEHYENARYARPYSLAYHEHTLERLTRLAPAQGVVLDDGCGNGLMFDHFARGARGASVERLYGIDLSAGMLGYARRRFDAVGKPGALVRGDACRLPFADGTFDVVYARSMLHHLPDPNAGAREIARVLRPGGTLVALDPNRTILSDLPRAIARRGDHFDDDHKNFKLAELVALLGAELELVRTEFLGYVAYPLLGFPDLIDFGRALPLGAVTPALLRVDDLLARIPGVRALGWGVVLVAKRR